MAESYADIAQAQIAPTREAASATNASRATRRRDERIEFYALYACCFSIFLFAVIVRRALVVGGIMDATDRSKLSVIGEAREAVGSTIPYAFMG
jgi:ABC-type Fe3+ transport system permease subunit